MKMWSGRFTTGPDKFFEQWQRSFPFDSRLLPQEIAASIAYARGLHRAGVLDSAELSATVTGLRAILAKAEEDPEFLQDDDAEDVHHFVENKLVARAGDVGLKLHSGRSRNEQIATDLRLYVREAAATVQVLLADLCAVLAERAALAGSSAMPAYTHLQRAEPVLVAHWLLAYFQMFVRDADRIAASALRANECPLGSGAIAGSTVALDRDFLSAELGFARPTANSMDATSDRDFAIDFVQALALLGTHLSRMAEEFILFSTQEFAFVTLPESYSTGSSAMPQKKNPDSMELIRAKSARLLGCSVALLTNVKGLPLAYNKDLQDTQEPLFEATEIAIGTLRVATGFLRDVVFNLDRMQSAASGSFMNAFAAATYLVNKGVPFRTAHEQVGKAVRHCLEKKCALEELSLSDLQKFSEEFADDFHASVSLESVLDLHNVSGGTNRQQVKAAVEAARHQAAAMKGETGAGA